MAETWDLLANDREADIARQERIKALEEGRPSGKLSAQKGRCAVKASCSLLADLASRAFNGSVPSQVDLGIAKGPRCGAFALLECLPNVFGANGDEGNDQCYKPRY